MQPSDYLTILNILVAFLGVAFAAFTLFEWIRLRAMRKDFQAMEARLRAENHAAMKAAHRIMASYGMKDVDQRLVLLESATTLYPEAFNGFNALGYAYLEKNETGKAIDAFREAVRRHPDDKAGYCDLAYAYLQDGEKDLAVKYFRMAVQVDASAEQDIVKDPRVKDLLPDIL